MLGDALVFPTGRSGWQKTVGAGGALLAVAVSALWVFVRLDSVFRDIETVGVGAVAVGSFLLSLSVVMGYHARVLRAGIVGDAPLPSFGGPIELFGAGVRLGAVPLVYGLGVSVAGILVALGRSFSDLASEPTPQPPLGGSTALSPFQWLVLLGVLSLTLGLAYVSTAAMARVAHEGRFGSAFEIRAIVRTAFTSDFFVGFVLGLGTWLVIGAIGIALVPVVIGVFLVFYASVVFSYLIGWGYGSATDHHTDTGASDAA